MKRTILSVAVLMALALVLWGCNPQEAGSRETTLPNTTGNGALQDTTVDETRDSEEIDLFPTDVPTDPPTTPPTNPPTNPPTDPPTDPPTTPPTAPSTTPPTDPPDTTVEETEEQTTQGGIELPLIPG